MARTFHGLAVAALVATGSLVARDAWSAPCSGLPSPTYIIGSSAVQPFIIELQKALGTTSTLVYQSKGSCVGVDAAINGTKMTGTATVFDATGTASSCDLDTTGTPPGNTADIGVSDVFATTCAGFTTVPTTVGDFHGPNQVMEFVVPAASSQKVISAEAAYFVFGFGTTGGVDPWIDETQLFVRSSTSGTQSMISLAINVPSTKWKGVSEAKSSDVLNAVAASTSPEKAIGILVAGDADKSRDKVQPLAFKAFKQYCGFYPDSSATSFDKINVRDGHYPIWGPLHFYSTIDSSGKPVAAGAKSFVGYFDGSVALPAGAKLIDAEINAHTVPACAMKVSRTTEVGDVAPFTPTKACGCYFDKLATGATSCTTCTADTDCTGSAKHCNYGYCEAS
jgi:hypothetical protein